MAQDTPLYKYEYAVVVDDDDIDDDDDDDSNLSWKEGCYYTSKYRN